MPRCSTESVRARSRRGAPLGAKNRRSGRTGHLAMRIARSLHRGPPKVCVAHGGGCRRTAICAARGPAAQFASDGKCRERRRGAAPKMCVLAHAEAPGGPEWLGVRWTKCACMYMRVFGACVAARRALTANARAEWQPAACQRGTGRWAWLRRPTAWQHLMNHLMHQDHHRVLGGQSLLGLSHVIHGIGKFKIQKHVALVHARGPDKCITYHLGPGL